MCVNQKTSISKLVAIVALPAALLLLVSVPNVEAAPGATRTRASSAARNKRPVRSVPAPQAVRRPAQGGFGGGGGWMNPSQMVLTSQGVMHRDTAARLGLPGTPIHGTPDHPFPVP